MFSGRRSKLFIIHYSIDYYQCLPIFIHPTGEDIRSPGHNESESVESTAGNESQNTDFVFIVEPFFFPFTSTHAGSRQWWYQHRIRGQSFPVWIQRKLSPVDQSWNDWFHRRTSSRHSFRSESGKKLSHFGHRQQRCQNHHFETPSVSSSHVFNDLSDFQFNFNFSGHRRKDAYAPCSTSQLEILQAAQFDDHHSTVWRISWNITGTILASSGDDGCLRMWKGNL